MARIGDVQTAIWADPDFEELSNNAAFLYIWSFTNPLVTPAGIYKVSRRKLLDGRLASDDLQAALDELDARRFLFYVDDHVWIRTHLKHLRTTGTNILRSVELTLRGLEGHRLLPMFFDEYEGMVKHGIGDLVADLRAEGLGGPLEDPSKTLDGPSQIPLSRAESEDPSETLPRVPGQGHGQGQPPVEAETPVARASAGARGRRKAQPPDPDALPADLSDELRAVAAPVAACLGRVAEAKGAKPVTLAAVGRALAVFPDHDHLRVAQEFEHYWIHGAGANVVRSDVVQTFRKRLEAVPVGRVIAGSVTRLPSPSPAAAEHAQYGQTTQVSA